jgi:hypothetical protein
LATPQWIEWERRGANGARLSAETLRQVTKRPAVRRLFWRPSLTSPRAEGEGSELDAQCTINDGATFKPLSSALANLHRALKQRFDPSGILNRGRMYPDF